MDILPDSLESVRVSAAGRALTILAAVASCADPVSAIDLAERLELPMPTVHRLMQLLEALGYLEREPGGKRFVTGHRLIDVACEALINSPYRSHRHTILQRLVDEVQETCNITMLSGDSVVYIDRVESHWPLRMHLQPGSKVPLHCGASGKVFLCFMPAAQRRRLLTAAPLKRYTEKTEIEPSRIEEQLKQTRRLRYGLDREEFMQGLIGIAVPVFDAKERVCATVSIHVPTVRHTVEQALEFVPALRRAAQAIGATLTAPARSSRRR